SNPHRVVNLSEQRRFVEPSPFEMWWSAAADDQLGAFVDTERDVRFDAVTLALGCERAEIRYRIGRVADTYAPHNVGHGVDDLVVTVPWNEYACERGADLPGMVDTRGHETAEEA